MDIPSYDILVEVARHGQYAVYRGRRKVDRQPVLLKAPLRLPPRPSDSEELQREFELLSRLSVAGIPRAYDLIRDANTACLVLEDRGLASLRTVLDDGRVPLASFFTIAISLCTILDELHRRQITHGGIHSAGVMVGTDYGSVHVLKWAHRGRWPTSEQRVRAA
jgi:serine/threonine protein kinase